MSLCFLRGFVERTRAVQLTKAAEEKQGDPGYVVQEQVDHEVWRPDLDPHDFPLPPQDLRCIVVELFRPFIKTTPVQGADMGDEEEEILELRKVCQIQHTKVKCETKTKYLSHGRLSTPSRNRYSVGSFTA